MRIVFLCLALMLGSCANIACADDGLFHDAIDESVPGGKDLKMDFQELRRDAKTSLIKVIHKSGASVPSIMFSIHGDYTIARQRGNRYFILLKEWIATDGAWMSLVGFCDDDTVDPVSYFGLSEKLPASAIKPFLAVAQYDLIFRDGK